jgi:2-keto-4-pentenoate hydratase
MAALSESIVTKEAEALHKAAQLKSTLPPLTARYPEIDPDGAYRIQLAYVRLKEKEGQKIVGKKIGLTSKAMQRMLSVDEPDYGHIFNGMLVEDGGSVHTSDLIQPKVEPEIAFILDRDLRGPGVTALDVLAATRFVVPALEIIDSRIESWKIKLCDTIADNASSGRVVLGSTPRSVDQINLRLVGMVLERNGEVVQTGAGAAVLGNPANAVAWLANAVGRYGVELKAGEIVMPGALTAAADVNCGDVFQACFDRLGSVSVRFV